MAVPAVLLHVLQFVGQEGQGRRRRGIVVVTAKEDEWRERHRALVKHMTNEPANRTAHDQPDRA
jgi:hypothetical protein